MRNLFPCSGTFWKKALVASACLTLVCSAQAQQKIATIDLKKVFEGYFKTKQADSLLQEHGAEAEKVLKGWLDDYSKANEDYKKLIEGANDQAVSADERDKRKKSAESKFAELSELQKSINQFRNEAKTRIDEQKTRLREKILAELRDAINAKAKLRGFSLVLDVSGLSANNGTQFLLYTDGQNDVSDEVLSELNAKAPPGALTTAPKEETPAVSQPKIDEKPKDEKPAEPSRVTKPAKKK